MSSVVLILMTLCVKECLVECDVDVSVLDVSVRNQFPLSAHSSSISAIQPNMAVGSWQ